VGHFLDGFVVRVLQLALVWPAGPNDDLFVCPARDHCIAWGTDSNSDSQEIKRGRGREGGRVNGKFDC